MKKIVPLLVPSLVVVLLALLAYEASLPTAPRCWKVPDVVPASVPVWVAGEYDPPRVCEDTMPAQARDGSSRPWCWQMVEHRGEECRR